MECPGAKIDLFAVENENRLNRESHPTYSVKRAVSPAARFHPFKKGARIMKSYIWAVVVFFLVMTGFASAESADIELSDSNSLSSKIGPFVFGEIPGASQGLFMIDTMTGRLWVLSEVQDKEGRYVLKPVIYKYGEEVFSYLPMDSGRPNSGTSVYRRTGE